MILKLEKEVKKFKEQEESKAAPKVIESDYTKSKKVESDHIRLDDLEIPVSSSSESDKVIFK